jgi:hypothetical protein
MIALRDGMPLVTLPDGRSTIFDKRWITASILSAAEEAGHHRWWLAEHIAESVSVYLQRDFDANTVEIPNLTEAVVHVLETLGFHDVAERFRLPDPPVSLSLTDLAREAGDGYELAFFGLLGERLQRAASSRSTRVEIHDLSGCVRLMGRRGNRVHRRSVKNLREEIVGFIRQLGEVAGQSRVGGPLEIQLS